VPSVFGLVLDALERPGAEPFDREFVRSLFYGGAPLAPTLADRLRAAFPAARLGQGYGLTESSSFCSYLLHDDPRDTLPVDRRGSVGRPVPVVDATLAPLTGSAGRQDSDPDTGEPLVRGPNICAGYWRQPEATSATFTDGWLRTGDLARIDADGHIHLVGRALDLIIRGGENVYPAEVERVLGAHPAVLEIAVVGVPSAVTGEKVAAALVLRPGAGGVLRAVLRAARSELARYKIPELAWVSSGPLPRNAGGKVDKVALTQVAAWGVAPR
jgi:acyl-CoA synthetase (AMP-forming)/AMP-acid ligase II